MLAGDVVARRFEIVGLAASGGMGAVYRAKDLESGERIALKVLLFPGTVEQRRFAHEARTLLGLSHPAIVRYVAHGEADGASYLAMEWLDGEDLGERIARDGALSLGEAIRVLERAAAALEVAHGRGIVHRDIKPSNIFLEGKDVRRVKLIDFGLALRPDQTERYTATGAFVGTIAYAPPERAWGTDPGDARGDVFSLGCVAFKCLTAQTPFAAADLRASLMKLALGEVPRVTTLAPNVPAELADLVARMLSRAPEDRPQNGGEVMRALANVTDRLAGAAPLSLRAGAVTRNERVLRCLVIACPRAPASPQSETIEVGGDPRRVAMAEIAATHGATIQRIADGSVAMVVRGEDTAVDQAVRAARCALGIRAAAPELAIAVVAERGELSTPTAAGDLVDRAVALLAGDPTSIRVDDLVAGLLATRFETSGDAMGTFLVSERAREQVARALLGKPTPFVGRKREKDTLIALYDECVEERVPRAALVTAPPGMGKSRLREEVVRDVIAAGAAVFFAEGDPFRRESPLALASGLVHRAAGAREDEPLSLRESKVRALARRHRGQEPHTSFLLELVGITPEAAPPEVRAARQSPRLMEERLQGAFADWLDGESAERPVVLVLEDLHWGDRPSVNMIDAAMKRLAARPLLVLALARPEVHELYPHLFAARALQEVRLPPLTAGAAERLAREVLSSPSAGVAIDALVKHAEGNPLYLEELLRAWAAGQRDGLPETLVAITQARLESLEPELRRALRAASVFGERFRRGGVLALTGQADLDRVLSELAAKDFLHPAASGEAVDADAHYVFHHALVRDAAYAMLTEGDRTSAHLLAARWLERGEGKDPVVLARHYELGQDGERAAEWYSRATERALLVSDFDAALAHASRGIACGVSDARRGLLFSYRAEVHMWRSATAEALAEAKQALALSPIGSVGWIRSAAAVVAASISAGDLLTAMPLVAELCKVDPPDEAKVFYAMALAMSSWSFTLAGQPTLAASVLARLERAVSPGESTYAMGWFRLASAIRAQMTLADPWAAREHALAAKRCFDDVAAERSSGIARLQVGLALSRLGAHDDAARELEDAIAWARREGVGYTLAVGLGFYALALLDLNRVREATAAVGECIAMLAGQKNLVVEGWAHFALGRAHAASGDLAMAERELREALAELELLPPLGVAPRAFLAELLLASGRVTDARREASLGLETVRHQGLCLGAVHALLIAARIAFADGDTDAGVRELTRARELVLARAEALPAEHSARFLRDVRENREVLDLWASLRRS